MTLDLYRQDALAPSRAWTALTPDERKRRVMSAVVEQDIAVLLDLLEAHHQRTHGHVSQETLRKYKLGARTWLDYAYSNAVNVLHPEAEQTDLWLRSLEDAKKAPSSVSVLLAGARALYTALRWAKATKDIAFVDAKPLRDQRRAWEKRQPYSPADLERLLNGANVEARVLLRLGSVAGLRASEITDLAWTDIELANRTLTVRNGKGGKSRKVLLSASLIADLYEWQSTQADTGGLVIGRTPEAARQRLRTLCRRLDVPYLGLHALRHAAGTRLLRAGFQLQDVAEHLGHSDVQTARIYAKWADDRLKEHFSRS